MVGATMATARTRAVFRACQAAVGSATMANSEGLGISDTGGVLRPMGPTGGSEH